MKQASRALLSLFLVGMFALVVSLIVSACGSSASRVLSVWLAGNQNKTGDQIIAVSADGARNWLKATGPGPLSLINVTAADADHGWVLGLLPGSDAAQIFASADGGRTWQDQYDPQSADVLGICCTDADHVWAVGGAASQLIHTEPLPMLIAKTSDGGAHWSSKLLPFHAGATAVAFADDAHGWITTFGPQILASTDGGASWSSSPIAKDGVLQGVAAVDATHAWAVGFKSPGGALIEATSDGRTWRPQVSNARFELTAVAFADRLHGWAAGLSGYLLATSDGGLTWRKQRVPTQGKIARSLADVATADSQHAWVTSGGTVYATSDGGAKWTLAADFPTDAFGALAATRLGGN